MEYILKNVVRMLLYSSSVSIMILSMNVNRNISPKEMVSWFRGKATEFNNIANTLEATFDSGNGAPNPQRVVVSNHDATLDEIKANAIKPKRAASIAAQLNTTREKVAEMIAKHPESFEIIGRGWIKAKQ
jgi:selenocysteine lyase/cysteine desulfurase